MLELTRWFTLLACLATASLVYGQSVVRGQVQMVLIEPGMASVESLERWKQNGFTALAVVLDEKTEASAYRRIGQRTSEAEMDLYWWIEVGRNAAMATANPRWMAALGSHEDWQKNFPTFPEPGIGEVAKAFPWVPIGYRETFDAHLARIRELIQRAPGNWRGLLLNDLQGGPAACGCGNLQCRWALDYHVPPTATKLQGNDVAARFLAEVRKQVPGKAVVPVWTTECSEADLPADKNNGRNGTGFCGSVGCARSACSEVFARQWSAVSSVDNGPLAILATHKPLRRENTEFGGGPGWVTNAIGYLEQTLPANGATLTPKERLWAVVEGAEARQTAVKAGLGGVVVSQIALEQSYEPRIVRIR